MVTPSILQYATDGALGVFAWLLMMFAFIGMVRALRLGMTGGIFLAIVYLPLAVIADFLIGVRAGYFDYP